MQDLDTLVNAIRPLRLLVLGDLILDRYTWGDAARVSPEAPVLVLRAEREEARLGGAAAVAMLVRALGASATPVGVTGHDANGQLLRTLLLDLGLSCALVAYDRTRPTTAKERLLAHAALREAQPLLRVDREAARPADPAVLAEMLPALLESIETHDAILVSDYAKGLCCPALLNPVMAHARACGVPVFVDPGRGVDYARYRGATLLTPNRVEAAEAAGRVIQTTEDALAAGAALCDRCDVAAVLVKLDSAGMVLVRRGEPGIAYPTRPRRALDVTGAGDTVLAMIGVCRAAGLDWDDAVPLANAAAGLQVERPGVAPVTWSEIRAALGATPPRQPEKRVTLAEMEALARDYRTAGKRVVFTNGCFDLLHAGHVACLQEAARLGDVLVVAVNSNRTVRRLKGPGRPVMGERDRAAMLAALACVDHVLIFDDLTPHELLRRLQPDVLVKGGTTAEVVGQEIVEAYGGAVHLTAPLDGLSSTGLIAAVRSQPAIT